MGILQNASHIKISGWGWEGKGRGCYSVFIFNYLLLGSSQDSVPALGWRWMTALALADVLAVADSSEDLTSQIKLSSVETARWSVCYVRHCVAIINVVILHDISHF